MELLDHYLIWRSKVSLAADRSRHLMEPRSWLVDALCCVLIFLAAFSVRHVLFSISGYSHLAGDENWYLRLMHQMMKTGVGSVYFWLPGWPYIMSLLTKLGFGTFLLRHVVMAIASFSCVWVFLIAKTLWGRPTGIYAALIMTLFPEHAFFSHYLYAEIGLEFIVLLFTLFVVLGFSSSSRRFFFIASFILGLGMLYKHFAVIPFVALMGIWILKANFKTMIISSLFFLLPGLFFSLYLVNRGQNPLSWFDSPIKSAQEWDRSKIVGHFKPQQRQRALSAHLHRLRETSAKEILSKWAGNAWRFWMPNQYVVGRLQQHRYKSFDHSLLMARLVYAGYLLVGLMGLAGLICAPHNFFKFYCAAIIVLLTAMGTTWFLVSRYHVPFMFVGVLYSAYMLTHARFTRLCSNANIASLKFIGPVIALGVSLGVDLC